MPTAVNTKAFGMISTAYGVAGQGVSVKEGTNAKQGVGTLVLGTVTIANTSVTANSRILITPAAVNASTGIGVLHVTARVAGVSFTVVALSPTNTTLTTDLSTFAWEIFEPA